MVNLILFDGLYQELINKIKTLPSVSNVDRFRGYLYIFKVNNRIKIGHSNDIYTRLKTHNNTAFCYSGFEIDRITVLNVFKDRYQAEMNLLYLIKKSNQFTQLADEWFAGSYDEIINISKQLTDVLTT